MCYVVDYSYDITFISLNLCGLNCMLDIMYVICYGLDSRQLYLFNSKKPICIKYGEDVKEYNRIHLEKIPRSFDC